jgi:phosphoribosylformylglycinamidine cyclo-ligase
MGSNGLTSARHDVFEKYLAEKYPESFDPKIPADLVYTGKYSLTQDIEKLGIDAGKLVLAPTRTYAPVVKKIIEQYRSQIHGIVHCSGGAQTKILHFIDNLHIIKDNMFEAPPLFKIIQASSNTSWTEMYMVFNMGHRMEIYVKPELADKIIDIAQSFNIDAQIIGRCEASSQKKLTIKSQYGTFNY